MEEGAVMGGAAVLCKALLKHECSSNTQGENIWEYVKGWLVIHALGKKIVRSERKEKVKSGRGRSSGGVYYVLGDPWSLYRPVYE